jgi:hypothetical protein
MESGIRQSEGGRPSTLLTINPDYGYFLGIEVGETFIQVELFDILFNLCQKSFSSLNTPKISPHQIVLGMLQGIEDVISRSKLSEKEIIGEGSGFPDWSTRLKASPYSHQTGDGITYLSPANCGNAFRYRSISITAPKPWQ